MVMYIRACEQWFREEKWVMFSLANLFVRIGNKPTLKQHQRITFVCVMLYIFLDYFTLSKRSAPWIFINYHHMLLLHLENFTGSHKGLCVPSYLTFSKIHLVAISSVTEVDLCSRLSACAVHFHCTRWRPNKFKLLVEMGHPLTSCVVEEWGLGM